jgi:hypothetical protein
VLETEVRAVLLLESWLVKNSVPVVVARQESFDEALKQAGIADGYERRAIAAELAADKEMADIFSRVLANEIGAATRKQAAPRRP